MARIAMVTYEMRVGGMEAVIIRLGCELERRGNSVDVVTTIEKGPWLDRASEAGLGTHHIARCSGWRDVSPVGHARRVGSFLRNQGYEVVILHHARYAQAAIALLEDRVAVIPVLHNDHPQTYRVGLCNSMAWDAAVAVSGRVGRRARELVGDKDVVVVENGVDLPRPRTQQRKGGEALRLVFVGRLFHEQKGIFFLPDVLRSCRDRGLPVSLEILGDGPDRAELEKRFVERNVRDAVHIRGSVEPAVVQETLLVSDVLVSPSFYEGLPIVLLEAQASGCPVIATKIAGSTDEIVAEGETGFLVGVGDVEGIVGRLEEIAGNASTWSEMSDAARRRAASRFSTAAMGNGYIDLIDRILSGQLRPRPSRRHLKAVSCDAFHWHDFLPGILWRVGRGLRRRASRARTAKS